jgi:hypothetical protein
MPLNPAGLVYGTITVATLLDAEGVRRETYVATVGAVALTMVLYWLAHSYAEFTGERISDGEHFTFAEFVRSSRRELSVLYGATVPLFVLLICWATGASLTTAVSAGIWAAVVVIVALEVVLGLRADLPARELAKQTAFGALLGALVLLLRVVLH